MKRASLRKIQVHYAGWGEDWLLGTLARAGNTTVFEYSDEALQRGIEHSPVAFPLGRASFTDFGDVGDAIPGFIHDALPDGYGLLLIDRLLQRNGIERPDVFDRLAWIGDQAMGALRFVPTNEADILYPDLPLRKLAEESQRVVRGAAPDELAMLAKVGGSAQGARPKALLQYDALNGQVSTLSDAPGDPWLFKFPSNGEHKEVCAIEALYADLARDAGIEIPKTTHIDLGRNLAAFGVKRFDRQQRLRVPMQSMAGLLQVNFRNAGSVDYGDWLTATRLLTQSQREVEIAFKRIVFNVIFHNRDDHPKNFAWLLGDDGRWRVSPAFDLTFSNGPGGQHHLAIEGHGTETTRAVLCTLAEKRGIPAHVARNAIDDVLSAVDTLDSLISDRPIRKSTQRTLTQQIKACAALVRARSDGP